MQMTQRPASDEIPAHAEAATPDPFSRSPRSLVRVLNIFETLANVEEGMTLTELSQVLNSPKSSLLALLRPLVGSDYLVHSAGRYRPGPAILQLSMNLMAGHSYTSLAHGFLQELASQSDESAYLTALDRQHRIVSYIDAIESRQAVRYAVGVGAVRPLFVSAAGRVLLAYQTPEWIESFLSTGPFNSPVTGEVVAIEELRQDLHKIREDGCAISLSQAVEGAAGIAAPLVDGMGQVSHALLLAAPIDRMAKSLPKMRELVIDVAGRASRALANARTYRPAGRRS
ncbi:transcriptional regulator, IclR family [Variovorax sp. HW608]|uniref:IclR family transcriptional regulator n=1 Tax=Variovorax sp. HW608 TaxID=1034889 RepID=UPI00081FEF87|nr:IclR family transcriptional regulator [Variovorax sp. HW608]SCK26090.1 transcriptional regulator, IclR family [Variovorax sp. HW608]